MGVDTSTIEVLDHELTASAFITTDRADNQITGFYPGAMSRARELGLAGRLDDVRLGVVSPTDPEAMRRHAEEFATAGVPYMFDPGQQIIALSAATLLKGIENAEILIGNDYEFAMISEKTGQSRDDMIRACPTVVVTYGELGSTIYHAHGKEEYKIPAVRATQVVDPTGAGDGYRAGFLAAMLADLPWDTVGRVASLAATSVVEVKGTQSHSYTFEEFTRRFANTFPEHADTFERLRHQRDTASR
jgi:adenosine kinase